MEMNGHPRTRQLSMAHAHRIQIPRTLDPQAQLTPALPHTNPLATFASISFQYLYLPDPSVPGGHWGDSGDETSESLGAPSHWQRHAYEPRQFKRGVGRQTGLGPLSVRLSLCPQGCHPL